MESRIEYWERYIVWLRIQLGVAKTEDVKKEINLSMGLTRDKINKLKKEK